MIVNKEIKQKIDRLINLFLIKGVQPSDFADNIFFDTYESIKVSKKEEHIVLEIFYLDIVETGTIKIKLRYVYDNEKNLLSIEEKVSTKKFKKIWDRQNRKNELVAELISLLEKHVSQNELEDFIETLPVELKPQLKQHFKLAA